MYKGQNEPVEGLNFGLPCSCDRRLDLTKIGNFGTISAVVI